MADARDSVRPLRADGLCRTTALVVDSARVRRRRVRSLAARGRKPRGGGVIPTTSSRIAYSSGVCEPKRRRHQSHRWSCRRRSHSSLGMWRRTNSVSWALIFSAISAESS
jgi:hypothetical protein